jgi:fibronectin-binding autotransporter adhesin
MKTMPHLLRTACLTGALLISFTAPAATFTWTGLGADDNLATGGNWDVGTPPTGTDSAVFTGFTRNAPVATAGVAYFTVLFDAGAGPFTFSGSAWVTGTTTPSGGGITNASGYPQVFNNAVNPRCGAMTASTEDIFFNGSFNVGNGGTSAGRHITNDGPRNIFYSVLAGGGTDTSTGGHLYRMGAGTTFLYGSSPSWNGRLVIRNGSVVVNNNNSLGSTTGTTLIESSGGGTVWDGRLVLSNNVTLPENFTLGSRQQGSLNAAHIRNDAGNNTLAGIISLTTGGARYNLQSDAGLFTVAGRVNAGTLTGNREFRVAGVADGELRGPISGGNAGIIFQFIKEGAGTWTLYGTNSISGSTLVNAGTLALGATGQISGSTNIAVAAGAVLDVSAVTGGYALAAHQSLAGAGSVVGSVATAVGSRIMPGGPGVAGTLTINGDLTLNAGTTNYFDLGSSTAPGVSSDLVVVNGNLNPDGAILVISSVGQLVSPGTYRLFNYTGSKPSSFGGVVAADTQFTMTLDETVPGQVNLLVSGTPASRVWSGGAAGTWDVGTSLSWDNNTARYFQNDLVSFDDSTASNTVTLNPTLYPSSVTVSAASNYLFLGAGKISGGVGINKSGPGSLTVSNANDFTGPVNITGGTFVMGNAAALGSTNGATFVSGGGTLDVLNKNLGLESITAEGAGVGGAGAVINTGAEQQTSVRFLTLSGDASIGGINRWDLRGPGGSSSFSGLLNLDGHTLTKVGANKIAVVDAVVTSAGDISVAEGTLSFTRSQVGGPGVIGLGNAILQLENNSTGYVAKPIIAGGGRLLVTGTAFSLWSPITNTAGLTVDNAVALALTNEFTGAGSLTKVGSGILTLERPAQHGGPTTISTGSVVLGADSGIPNSSAISVGSGALLDVFALPGGLVLNSGQTLGGGGTVAGNVTAGAGTSFVPGTSPGTLTINGNLGLNNSGGTFELGANPTDFAGNDSINVQGELSLAGVSNFKIVPIAPLDTVNPYTLLQYSSFTGSAANLNVTSDSRYSFTLLDPSTTVPYIQVQVAGSGAAATLTWRGNNPVNPTSWDTKVTTNWVNGVTPDKFFLGDTVVFDDTAVATTVDFIGTLQPSSVSFNNATKPFSLGGAGSLVAGSATASGSAPTVISNNAANSIVGAFNLNSGLVRFENTGANTVGGGVNLNGGTLILANLGGNTLGSTTVGSGGSLTVASTTASAFSPLTVSGGDVLVANAVANTFSGISLDWGTLTFDQPLNLTLGSVLSGGGLLVKKNTNTFTLNANNSGFSGKIQVDSGSLRAGAANALGSGSGFDFDGTTIASGATLDVNAINLGNELVTVSGTGVGGLGAIVNNSGTGQNNALHDVLLVGDTTFGGVGRWDIRTNATGAPNLNTGGNAYKITKLGANHVTLFGANVDPALGDIDVQQGGFGYEFSTSSLGDPSRTLNVASNAYFLMWSAANPLDKRIQLQGGAQLRSQNGANVINGPVLLPGGSANLAVDFTLTLNNEVSGAGGLEKSGTATAILTAANTFSGPLVITNGSVIASHAGALGTDRTVTVRYGTTTGGQGTRLALSGGIVTPASVTAHFTTTTNGGDFRTALASDAGSNVWTGPVFLTGDALVNFNAPAAATFGITGPIAASNSFTATAFFRGGTTNSFIDSQLNLPQAAFNITDNSVWLLNSTGNLWARSQVALGRVVLGADNALCPTAPLSLGQPGTSSGTLDLNGHVQEIPALVTVNGVNHFIGSSSTTADSTFIYQGGAAPSIYGARIVDSVAGGTMKVGVRVVAGTLQLDGANTHTGPTEVAGGVLSGNGSLLSPVTVLAGGTLAPGASIGILSVTNTVTLGGTNVMEVSKSSGTITNDLLRGVSTLTYGGTLLLTLDGDALAAGDSLKLYDAAAYAGTFAAIQPATPGAGLVWDTSELATAGTLKVAPEAAPPITGISLLPDGNFALTLGGTVGQPYTVRASSDVSQPFSTWTILSSGLLPSVPFTYTDLTATNHPIRFYGTSSP